MARGALFLVMFAYSLWSWASEDRFYEICKTDVGCMQATSSLQKKIFPPSDQSISLLCSQRDYLLAGVQVVNSYDLYALVHQDTDVAPETLAACLLAERNLLFETDDGVINGMLSRDPSGRTLKTLLRLAPRTSESDFDRLTIGISQIQVATARSFYPMLFSDEEPSDAKLIEHLLGPINFQYASALLKEAIWAYGRYSEDSPEFDIRQQPSLLCTLYQLGGAPRRSQASQEQGRTPRPNFYGIYAESVQEVAAAIVSGEACQ